MSHITKVETKLKELGILQKALKALGYEYRCAEENSSLVVNGWNGEEIEADMEICLEGPYGIAVHVSDQGLELSADWWGVETYTEKNQTDFLTEIQKQYAYETVLDKVREGGYSIVSEEQDSKESLHIVLRRWV